MDAARERERTSAVELERKEDALRDSQERELDALREEHRQRMRDEEKSGGGGGGDDDDSSGSAAQVVSLQKDATTVMPADNTIATVPVDNVAVVVPTDNAGGAQKTPPWPPKEDSQKELDLVDLDKVVGVEGGHQKVLLNDSKAIGNTIMASKDVANTMALVSANNATAVVPADNGAADNGTAVVPMGNTAGAQNMSSQPQKKESQKELHLDFDKVYAAKGGIQMVGGKFIEHYKTPKKAAKNIPPVEVKFKVRRLSDWDSKAGTFYVDCLLMLDWEDPSLSRATDSENPDFADHFWPQAEMEGVTPGGGDEPDWENTKPKYKPEFEDDKNKTGEVICHRATITIKYKMVLFARCNFRGRCRLLFNISPPFPVPVPPLSCLVALSYPPPPPLPPSHPRKRKTEYPFDHQTLEISIKLLSVRIPFYIKGGVRPVAKHPKMRKKHQLIKDCDCLPEYDFVRLSSRAYSSKYGPFISKVDEDDFRKDEKKGKLYQDMYTLQVVMVRDSVSVMWNMCFSLFVIDVMVFAAHGIPMGDLADRMSVNLTLLLTAMAFKWVLSDQLPPVPYLTTMEKVNSAIIDLFC
jgi:hypothetical protein